MGASPSQWNRLQQLEFAKSKSDATAKRDGSWAQKQAQKRKGEKLEAKQAKKAQNADSALSSAQAPGGSIAKVDEGEEMEVEEQNVGGSDEPNKTLFVEHLPAEVNETMLKMLFQQFRNFNEVRWAARGRFRAAFPLTLHTC